MYREIIHREKLEGVILAHHADDQAETILLRLLRGSGPAGLAGMRPRTSLQGITILRPLLEIRRHELRAYLAKIGQSWREDASNRSDKYARNRIRQFLASRPELHEPVLSLGRACAEYRQWIVSQAPRLKSEFPAVRLESLPNVLVRESLRRWLIGQGVPPGEIDGETLDRLAQMCADAATPRSQLFAGNVRVSRRRGWISPG
jgi:tRNA(Ile)-lysidine synthase TilS/MesJ